jgi:uncharacterized protein Veg
MIKFKMLGRKVIFLWLQKNTLSLIKSNIDNYVGERVVLRANKGRKKISIKQGVIEKTYPSIFLVRIDGEVPEDFGRTVSFSYSDILTKSIELFACKDNVKIGCM